jgi:hypothetical protein
VRAIRHEPFILRESGVLQIGSRPNTFVAVCGPAFDQRVPTAGVTSRLGWCAGFEQIGVPYLLLSVKDIARRLPELPRPVCLISASDYAYLDSAALAAMKRSTKLVWVDTWFRGEETYRAEHALPPNTLTAAVRKRVLSSSPDAVFTISPERCFDLYALWSGHGVPLLSLPLACDTSRYSACPPHFAEFDHVQMAFVGGYWPYKARQLDRYLSAYQDRLTVYGYSTWPYARYGGTLSEDKEASLYHQALLSPCINEPHVELMGGVDINERVFKILGSGGVALTDAVVGYRDWFAEDELLVPASREEFDYLAARVLADMQFRDALRRRGCEAVLRAHTYAHRAARVLEVVSNHG